MTRTHLSRHLAAIVAALGMLFSQLALAAYACPMERMTMTEALAEAECCRESASATASLCHEHCKDSQLAAQDSVPDLPGFVPAFTVTLPVASMHECEYSQATPAHLTSPPLFILNCCFRI